MVRFLALLFLLLGASALTAQTFQSHEVRADGAITFRYVNHGAAKVSLSIDAFAKALPMTRGEGGVWTVTTPPLPPEFYGYTFLVDGAQLLDPRNTDVRPNVVFGSSVVEVKGATPQPWDTVAIPHGRVDRHVYTTKTAKHLPSDQNAYMVYTPPGYDAQRKGGYPVLYLLHGWSDDETGWVSVGHANDILDAAIDGGSAVPMIVVMPLGYGDFHFVTKGFGSWDDEAKVDANTALFTQTLLGEIVPAVEAEYNVAKGRENRAISGLSMGGLETLSVGLNHSDQFAWVAGMSAAVFHNHFDTILTPGAVAQAKKYPLRLLWLACGTGERLLPPNQELVARLKASGSAPVTSFIPGTHTWLVWRANLVELLPKLFRK